ncbi:hypothetical protein EX30DRAFT_370676 [Ascodesmis nigricans]|uniref:R3H-associated N-terminal domain-containing protein n=1 Tax=Ascodesmis nigricans TaxID=341454 RepID=A0A4S2N0J8_9PEZI|nr:hypothetical protein EX30DRAFT_370676 [Ascodesmis nigricans]
MAIPDSPARVQSPVREDMVQTGDTAEHRIRATSPPATPQRIRAREEPREQQPRVQLTIPLDATSFDDDDDDDREGREKLRVKKKKKVLRRDSLDRREALLRGKEGSRRRRRWDNAHFTLHPHYSPPAAVDWIPAPHYNLTPPVPYQYAALYDHPELIRRREEAAAKAREAKTIPAAVPRRLKDRVKKAHGAVGLVEALEREVRRFVFGEEDEDGDHGEHELNYGQAETEDGVLVMQEDVSVDDDSSDEEIVFVSKRERGHKRPSVSKSQTKELDPEKGWIQRLVFEGAVEESFARWIVHTIAGYYGLTSWSVSSTAVGVPEKDMKGGREMRYSFVGMRPWEKVLDRRPLYLQL